MVFSGADPPMQYMATKLFVAVAVATSKLTFRAFQPIPLIIIVPMPTVRWE